ncbi:hypothetical protein [Pseudovibrio axinellae]|uniref:hypothetical protein n=1 Tax=Pseudovibrio axinellae TaxID=989403 RepID=UPI00082FF5E4|nr:hypothetical protein [Pseudovibrio axinellae]
MQAKEVEERKRAAYYQLNSLSAIAKLDAFSENFTLNEKMPGYVADYFSVRRLWVPPSKERLPEIGSRDHKAAQLLDQFAYPEQSLDKKILLLEEIINMIYDFRTTASQR